ncbi:MAG TPA: PEP/pyruvate-binding domain-containing protein [Coleofasciculaceae cyanobacterium]
MTHIFYPQDLGKPQAQLGGKARTLATLAAFNLPIPAWFVLAPAAELALDLSESLQAELAAALSTLCPAGELVAVRSSALDEDGSQQSFAGQLDSFLNVPLAEVVEKVVAVRQSGFSDRLRAYRQEHQLCPPQCPAVLIQRMVPAEVAGVAFSANPVTGQRGVVVISAVQGLGDRLVSGESEGETYQVDRAGQIARTAVDLPAEEPPHLDPDQIRAIAALARQVEHHLGRPQDIEWAIAEGKLYLLQARPITTLVRLADPDGGLNLWDNSNIAESYGGITTPLTFSFARRVYQQVYRQFCQLMGVPAAAIVRHDLTFRRLLGLIQGRIYYNLLNWYRVLALLPGFTVNRRFMEQMMGVQEELPADVLAELAQSNLGDKMKDVLRLGRTVIGLVQNYLTLPRQIQRFDQRLDRALGDACDCPGVPIAERLAAMRADELVDYYHQLEQQLLNRWDAPLVNDFFAMIFYGVLRKLTAQWGGDQDGTLQNDLISGEGGMISAEPADRIRAMVKVISPYPELVQQLCQDDLPAILHSLPQVPVFQAQYQDYLATFGDRCLEELKLESSTLQDDPLPLLRSIGQLAAVPDSPARPDLSSAQSPADSPRSLAEARVRRSIGRQPLRRLIFGWVLDNARARIRDRENLRFQRTRVFGRVRRILVELGKRLYALDQLIHPKDIFYLELDEIFGFLDGTATCTRLKDLVQLRQAEFEQYRTMAAPSDRFSTRGNVHPITAHAAVAAASVAQPGTSPFLQGTGCCPGIVRAPVQVITHPKTTVLRPGSILVAERTDPGWIMLFPAAAGLLVERGSLLSHSAIVSREMGIPTIVSLPGITQWLQDGDWVEMDGSTGRVQRLASGGECPATEQPGSGQAVCSAPTCEMASGLG